MDNNQDSRLLLWAHLFAMPEARWRERLKEELAARKLSWRRVSVKAGLSPGYISSLLTEGKEPTLENIEAICDAAGISLMQIILGWPIDRDTEQILRALAELPKERRDALLSFLLAGKPDQT